MQTGVNEVADDAIDGRNHQMNVNRGSDAMIAKSLAHARSDGQVRNVMVVHHVEMNNLQATGLTHARFQREPAKSNTYIRSSREHIVNLLAELGKVGGQNGRRDEVILASPHHSRRGAGRERPHAAAEARGHCRRSEGRRRSDAGDEEESLQHCSQFWGMV